MKDNHDHLNAISLKDAHRKSKGILCGDDSCTRQHYDLADIEASHWTDKKLKSKPIISTWVGKRSIHRVIELENKAE
jgi:hypothetical protein